MTKKILILLFYISLTGFSFGQINVSGTVYSDSSRTQSLSKVKLILRTADSKKTFKVDKNGAFDFQVDGPMTDFDIEIRKKGYIAVILEGITKDIKFDVILRPSLTLHDTDYQGASEIIIRN